MPVLLIAIFYGLNAWSVIGGQSYSNKAVVSISSPITDISVGTFVAPNLILTAAHVVDLGTKKLNPGDIIYLASNDVHAPLVAYAKIKGIYKDPRWSSQGLQEVHGKVAGQNSPQVYTKANSDLVGDIAFIELTESFSQFNQIKICQKKNISLSQDEFEVVGSSSVRPGEIISPTKAHVVIDKIFPDGKFKYIINKYDQMGKQIYPNAAEGDSGGPILADEANETCVLGVTSHFVGPVPRMHPNYPGMLSIDLSKKSVGEIYGYLLPNQFDSSDNNQRSQWVDAAISQAAANQKNTSNGKANAHISYHFNQCLKSHREQWEKVQDLLEKTSKKINSEFVTLSVRKNCSEAVFRIFNNQILIGAIGINFSGKLDRDQFVKELQVKLQALVDFSLNEEDGDFTKRASLLKKCQNDFPVQIDSRAESQGIGIYRCK